MSEVSHDNGVAAAPNAQGGADVESVIDKSSEELDFDDPVTRENVAAAMLLSSGRFSRSVAKASSASTASWRILAIVSESGPMRVTELANNYGCSQPTATNLAQRAENAGYIQRQVDSRDTRAVQISITEKGAAELGRMRMGALEMLKPFLESLTEEDARTLHEARALLDRAIESVSK